MSNEDTMRLGWLETINAALEQYPDATSITLTIVDANGKTHDIPVWEVPL